MRTHWRMLAHTLWRSRRMARDRRGVSAIEFAMIAPILILLYVGIVEIGNLLTINRRTSSVAATAADLTAQLKAVASADLQDILKASGTLLTPYSTTPLKVVLSSVVADKNNVGKVDWSCASEGAGRGAGSNFALPAGVTDAETSVIVAEVTYSYKPMLGLDKVFRPDTFELKRSFYARPRKSVKVTKTEAGCPSV